MKNKQLQIKKYHTTITTYKLKKKIIQYSSKNEYKRIYEYHMKKILYKYKKNMKITPDEKYTTTIVDILTKISEK